MQNAPALISSSNSSTMSSREIADLTGKELSHVHRDIKAMMDDLIKDDPKVDYPDLERDSRGYIVAIHLNRELTDTLLTGYSAVARNKVIKRWHELERKQAFEVPKTLSGALMLAAKQAEQIEKLELQAKVDAPKVEFALAVRNLDGSCSIGEFSALVGIGQNIFFGMLRSDKILMINNRAYQEFKARGLLVEIENTPYTDHKGKSHPTFQTRVTGKGQVWLEKKYRSPTPELDLS